MPSSYNSQDLFGSGPHRFTQAPLGEYVLRNAVIDPFQAGSQAIGPLELTITVRGRLVAADETALWELRDTIALQLNDPPTVAELVEPGGRTWNNMAFVNFTPGDRTDRGRTVSLAYTATFIRFLSP